jgi:hypothetical protein
MIAMLRFPALAARLAAGPIALFLAATPAAANEVRSTMSVSAWVEPTCGIGPSDPSIPCSAGPGFSAMTAARADERPLDEAAAILGAPVRDGEAVRLTAPVRPSRRALEAAEPAPTSYRTITY